MGQTLCGKLVDEELGELVTLDYTRLEVLEGGKGKGRVAVEVHDLRRDIATMTCKSPRPCTTMLLSARIALAV